MFSFFFQRNAISAICEWALEVDTIDHYDCTNWIKKERDADERVSVQLAHHFNTRLLYLKKVEKGEGVKESYLNPSTILKLETVAPPMPWRHTHKPGREPYKDRATKTVYF